MSWQYDSGGHKRDDTKYKENYSNIFGKPCSECGMTKGQHKMDCSMNWRAKRDGNNKGDAE